MSTKAIKTVLDDYRDRMEDSLSTELSAAQRKTDEHNLALATQALAEVEAIERASADLGVAGWWTVIQEKKGATKAEKEAAQVLATIAREAQ